MKQIIILSTIFFLLFYQVELRAQTTDAKQQNENQNENQDQVADEMEEGMIPEDSILNEPNEPNENAGENQDQDQNNNQNQNDDSSQDNQKYVFGSIDIPLFEGLKLRSEDSTDFDSTSGNITISIYQGKIDVSKLRDFYLESLPQLGWELSDDDGKTLTYKRDADLLKIAVLPNNKSTQDGEIAIKFFISVSVDSDN